MSPPALPAQDLVPGEEWQRTAVVLACLESIYRAEYQGYAAEAVAALQVRGSCQHHQCGPVHSACHAGPHQACTLHVLPPVHTPCAVHNSACTCDPTNRRPQAANGALVPSPDAEIDTASPWPRSPGAWRRARALVAARRKARQQLTGSSTPAGPLTRPAPPSASSPPSPYSGSSPSSQDGEQGLGVTTTYSSSSSSGSGGSSSWRRGGSSSPSPSPLLRSEPEGLREAAARLDAELAAALRFLVQRSHFDPLTRRDAEVAKAFNRDYLSQLFIKVRLLMHWSCLLLGMAQPAGIRPCGVCAAALHDIVCSEPCRLMGVHQQHTHAKRQT